MKVAIDQNEMIADRLNGSYSGYAGLVARSAIKAAVILYCARAWDKARDSVSLRRAFDELPALDDLNARRSEQLATLGIDFDEATLAGRHAKRVSGLLCNVDPVHASSKGSMHDDLQGPSG